MTTRVHVRRLHAAVGELVVAIVDAAGRVTDSERNAYCLSGLVLNRMLQPVPVVVDPTRDEAIAEFSSFLP